MAAREVMSDRVAAHIPTKVLERAKQAAEIKGLSLTAFIRNAAFEAAKQAIATAERTGGSHAKRKTRGGSSTSP